MRTLARRIVAWAGERLRGARYLVGDALFAVGQAFRGLGTLFGAIVFGVAAVGRGLVEAATGLWGGLSLVARRRLVALLGIAVLVVLFVTLAVPNLPCQVPGGDRCAPHDDAAEIVPADALAYVHANLDPDTDQVEELRGVIERAPLITQQIAARSLALVPGPDGGAPDYGRDLSRWFAGEAALAVLGGRGAPEQALLLEYDDEKRARRYADSIADGELERSRHRGVELAVDSRGLASARAEGFLVIGERAAVEDVIDTATGREGAEPLADDELAEDVRGELPDHRFVEAWVSAAGAEELVASSDSILSTLSPLISPGTTRGAAVSISAGGEELELAVRSELDPEREKAAPGFFAAFPAFEPELAAELSESALAYLGIGRPASTVRALLDQAEVEAPGVLDAFEALVERLAGDGVDVRKQLLPSLGEEAAIAIEPRGGGSAGGLPYLELIGAGVDEEQARRALARLQGPLAGAVDAESSLQAPVFGERDLDGVEMRSLVVSPTIELAYAAFDEKLVLATDPAGVRRVVEGDGGLDESDAFERATEDFEDEVSLLAYLDLGRLLEEGYEIGLAEVPAFNTFAPELRALDALGVSVRTDDDRLETDLRLLLGEPLTSRGDD